MDDCKSLIVLKQEREHSVKYPLFTFYHFWPILYPAVTLKLAEFRTLSKNSSKQHHLLVPRAQRAFSAQRTNPQTNTFHPELTPPQFFFPEIICLEDCALCVNDQGVGECISRGAKVRVELWIHSPRERTNQANRLVNSRKHGKFRSVFHVWCN